MPATLLVTGAAGFLGMNAGLWLDDWVRTIGQTRFPQSRGPFDSQVAVDLRDAEATAELVRQLRPDVVLNAAAISGHETCANDPDQAHAVNVLAAGLLSGAAADIGSRFIHISTDAVFSGMINNVISGRINYPTVPEPSNACYFIFFVHLDWLG